MSETYIFDKRIMKKKVIKFLIESAFILPILVGINFLLSKIAKDWLIILIDVIIGLILVWVIGIIYDKIALRVMEKRLAKIEKLRKINEILVDGEKVESENAENKKVLNKPKKKKRKRRNKKEKLNGKNEN